MYVSKMEIFNLILYVQCGETQSSHMTQVRLDLILYVWPEKLSMMDGSPNQATAIYRLYKEISLKIIGQGI